MLDEDVLFVLMFFLTIIIVSIGWPLARAWARRIDRQSAAPKVPSEVTERLARMEQAIDSMAIEIERISEGQRFTTRLLAERSPAALGEGVAASGARADDGRLPLAARGER